MDALPTELRRQILAQCTVPAVQSLRLTSKLWGTLGFEYLLTSTFTALPLYPDFNRLLSVSQVPILSHKIQSIFINLGEINEYHARHNTYFIQYMRDPDERFAAQDSSWGAYATLKAQKEQYMPLACIPELLDPAFKNLPNLRKVDVSLATCPFPGENDETELWCQIWRIPSTRLFPRVATTERFTNLCTAIIGSPARVEELSHDRLPLEFFAQKPIIISLVSTVFLPLTKLSLGLDYSDMPNNLHSAQAFQNLSHCLRSASGLESFSLSFQGRKKTSISSLFSSFRDHKHTFKSLKEVKFEFVRCTENNLVEFLVKHKDTLKKVQLGGVGSRAPHQKARGGLHLDDGTWKSVFERVLAQLDLQQGAFLAQGDMVDPSGRAFVLEDLEPVEDLGSFVSD